MIMMLTLAIVAAAPGAPSALPPPVSTAQRDQAWVLGYTNFVRYICPTWRQRIEAFSPDVLPSVETWNGAWAQDGPLAVAHRNGMHAAETAQRADAAFCEHPTRAQPERARVLQNALTPRPRER